MNQEDQILALWDEYFATVSQNEIDQDVKFINTLASNGVSFEEYLISLNGLNGQFDQVMGADCDDIYINLVSKVKMDDASKVMSKKPLDLSPSYINLVTLFMDQVGAKKGPPGEKKAGESNYAMAA